MDYNVEITKKELLMEQNNDMAHNFYYKINGKIYNKEKTKYKKFKFVLSYDIFDLQDADVFSTMTIYAVLTTGFAMLFRMIKPVNVFRGIMFVVVLVLSVFAIVYFPDLFHMARLTNEVHYLMVMLMAFMGYALIALFDGLLSRVKLTTGKNS